jgi:hypothetical protein
MKIHPVGAELFPVNRQMGTMKLIVTFNSFAEALKNYDFDKPHPTLVK